jgi:predicted DsbA family dithiol-disulfide isomerase
MLDAIYAAYFEHGRDIGDVEVLVALAEACGQDGAATRAALEGNGGMTEVLADVAFARQVGISGVPFFILDDRYAFSGAQPVAVMRRVLEQVTTAEVE